jgi:hypothetical protein
MSRAAAKSAVKPCYTKPAKERLKCSRDLLGLYAQAPSHRAAATYLRGEAHALPGCANVQRDLNGPRQVERTILSDEFLKKYGLLSPSARLPCQSCFRRLLIGTFNDCHVKDNKRVYQLCTHSKKKGKLPWSPPNIFVRSSTQLRCLELRRYATG